MGLLDWMTEGLGNIGASASPGTMPPDMAAVMPPVQQTGDDTPPLPQGTPPMPAPPPGVAPPISGPNNNELLPFAKGGDPMAGTGSGNNGGLPPPAPYDDGAGLGGTQPSPMPPPPPGPVATPPNAAPTAGTMPPGPPMSLAPPTGGLDVPGPNGKLDPASSWIGGKLGLDSNKEKSFFGSLGAGLTAAGNSKGKSKGQALFSGAGGAIEGGQKAEEKSYDQRLKSLQLAVQAQAAGDKANYNLNYAKYLGAKLKADTDKAASAGKGGAWNKPDSQKYIDGKRSVANDPEVDTAAKQLQKMNPANPGYAAAQAQLQALIEKKEQQTFAVMGLKPETIAAMNGKPPGTRDNPHAVKSQQDFDRYVKPGDVYINPRDGKPYIRNKGGDGAGDSAAAATAPDTAPEPPGLTPERGGESDEHEEL